MKYAYRIFHTTLLYALFTFREPHLQLLSQFICKANHFFRNDKGKFLLFIDAYRNIMLNLVHVQLFYPCFIYLCTIITR